MELLEMRVLKGPNYWSTYRKQLIEVKLDLQELEHRPTHVIDGFTDRLEALMPSLFDHRCSENRPGGFFERLRKGTWMGHVVEHIALELQTVAGMPCGFGRTRSTGKKGIYHVVFAYQLENAGIFAAKAAVRMAETLARNENYDISPDINKLVQIKKNEGFGPSTNSLINEAKKRNIPYKRIDANSLVMFGQGKHQKMICATTASTTSTIGVELAADKNDTRNILSKNFIPVPEGSVVSSEAELRKVMNDSGFPLVIKPVNGNHGRAVKINIRSGEEAVKAFWKAKEFSDSVIVERFVNGHDYRFLLIDFKLQAVARRTPAMIIGDNHSTIQELIDRINSDPRRGQGHEKVLTFIEIDSITEDILKGKNLELNSVLPSGEILFLKDAANLSAGGTATDVTDLVHPFNIALAERSARLMNLNICGVDMIAEDITFPVNRSNGAVIEVNAGPGFRMHLAPTKGKGRNVAEPVLKMLYPEGSPCRIPIIAITGTNGKTTTTRLISHLAKQEGYTVGYTTTDGIYINDQIIFHGDCAGPSSAEVVLSDPIVDFAVFECARGGILRSGLAFDKCDISIITNITEDHLGLNDINTLDQLVRVKGVVARSTMIAGYAILNADDDLVYGIRESLDCNIALFSLSENNPRVRSHCDEGGLAVVIEKGYFTLWKGEWRVRVARVKDVPLTLEGRAISMIKNILPAILAAAIRDFDIRSIRRGLQSFIPGPETTPGRMNIFQFKDYNVIIDYAHNPDGIIQLGEFVKSVNSSEKIGIIACPGDRRDQDIQTMGFYAAQIFDKLIIRHDKDGRGRTNEDINNQFMQGIHKVNSKKEVVIVSDEIEALAYAMEHALKGALIIACSEEIQKSIDFLTEAKNTELKSSQLHDVNR
ncbi:MAG: cyanophycin synthetase [Chitinophagaceae bacterium]|nr:cyanophycin synthetase [Chitinophagaceae bacterium]